MEFFSQKVVRLANKFPRQFLGFVVDKSAEKDTQRRQLDTLLDSMSEKGIRVVTATAKEIAEVETEDRGMSRTEF